MGTIAETAQAMITASDQDELPVALPMIMQRMLAQSQTPQLDMMILCIVLARRAAGRADSDIIEAMFDALRSLVEARGVRQVMADIVETVPPEVLEDPAILSLMDQATATIRDMPVQICHDCGRAGGKLIMISGLRATPEAGAAEHREAVVCADCLAVRAKGKLL